MSTITWDTIITREVSFTPYDVKWIPCSAKVCTFGVTNQGTGKIAVYGMAGKHLELKHETETSSAVRCGTVTGQARHFATGDFDGQLQIWDTQQFDIPLVSYKAHDSIINCIDNLNQTKEPQELVTGSRDGSVKVWDARQPEKPVLTIKTKETKDIWAVAYGQLKGLHKVIAIGYENGDIKLFDVKGAQYLWQTQVKDGICSIDFDKDVLLVSTLSAAYIIDIITGNKTELPNTSTSTSPNEPNTLWAIRHIPQHPNYFTIGAGDGHLTTWDQQSPSKPLSTLNVSKHPIISLDWHKDKKGLFACSSFDQTIKIGMFKNE